MAPAILESLVSNGYKDIEKAENFCFIKIVGDTLKLFLTELFLEESSLFSGQRLFRVQSTVLEDILQLVEINCE